MRVPACGTDAGATQGRAAAKERHQRAYTIWLCVKTRCLNLEHPSSKEYGRRGIKVCERWEKSFAAFLEDMGDPPEGLSIERKDTNGHYEPGNCIWATRYAQNNNRRDNRRAEWKGEQRTFTNIARMENVAFCSFRNRVCIYGQTVEQAIEHCRARGLTYKERAKCMLSL